MNICELLENNLNTQQLQEQQEEQKDETNTSQKDNEIINDNNNLENESNNKLDSENNINTSSLTTESLDKQETSSSNLNTESSSSVQNDSNEEHEDDIDYNKMIDFFSTNDAEDYKPPDPSSLSELAFDALNPFEKFCKLCDTPTPSNIESASKYVVPALEFSSTQEDYMRVFFYLKKYCFYSDVLLRSLWLEQIQNVIQYLHQEQDNISVEFTDDFNMPNRLAVLISDLMREQAYQVKKCATASLLYIIEKQLLDNNQIEQIIVPCLLSLVKENNEDFHIDCVSLFGKLAPLIGRELTTKYFLEPFCRLCSSPVFHTRKACASNIADIANIVSIEEVEKYLLPHFCEFMKDQVWAIRKVCADLFSTFALRCTRQTRENVLTECFTRLLDDHSRWVKISAYKSLGSFIATFSRTDSADTTNQSEQTSNEQSLNNSTNKKSDTNTTLANKELDQSNNKTESNSTTTNTLDETKKEGEYSNLMYWKNPLPPLDESIQTTSNNESSNDTTKSSNTATVTSNNQDSTPTLTGLLNNMILTDSSVNNSIAKTITQTNLYSSTSSLFSNQTSQTQQQPNSLIDQLSKELKQDIVPPILLSYFVTMVDINTQNSLDSEMNYNCAFNFPAIALTLGVKYWKFIKNLYKKLAEDVSWKVRQTLAYSIHELAIILGTEHTQNDLVPVFDSYIKDVDEVRIGIVANLTKFLKVLSMDYRRSYMPKLNDFLKMDNQRNWRFRNELGLQIAKFCELFPSDCLAEFVQPVTFTLALDKVAEVRVTAVRALVEILRQFEINKRQEYRRNFIDDVIRTFANSNKWTFRQLYVTLCENILQTTAYSDFELFSRDFLPKLLFYRNEKVPNIRVLTARVLTTYVINSDYFKSGKCTLANELELTIQYLSNDPDSDVRSYFSNESKPQNSSLPSYEELYKNKENESLDKKTATSETSSTTNSTEQSLSSNSEKLNKNQDDDEEEEDDDDDDEDEIIDKTKINQLKIVNLDNELDEEIDEILESQKAESISSSTTSEVTTETSPDTNSPNKTSTNNTITTSNTNTSPVTTENVNLLFNGETSSNSPIDTIKKNLNTTSTSTNSTNEEIILS